MGFLRNSHRERKPLQKNQRCPPLRIAVMVKKVSVSGQDHINMDDDDDDDDYGVIGEVPAAQPARAFLTVVHTTNCNETLLI